MEFGVDSVSWFIYTSVLLQLCSTNTKSYFSIQMISDVAEST